MEMPTSPDGEERAFFFAFLRNAPKAFGVKDINGDARSFHRKETGFLFYTEHGVQVNTIVPLQPLKFKKGVFACHRI